MSTSQVLALAFMAACAVARITAAEALVTADLPIGYLPPEWVKAALQKTLSPQGRTTLTTPTGPLRVSDAPEKVAALRHALATLQQAPALVPVELSFATTARRTVQRLPVEPPVVNEGIPVPSRYAPPRIISNGAGTVTVIPSQPGGFATRNVGAGAVINPGLTGYATEAPEVRLTETVSTSAVLRRFSASLAPGKPLAITVLKQVADPAALQALAQKLGAIGANEPAWTAAGSELLLQPELAEGTLILNVTPQIVLPPTGANLPLRRIQLSACAAGILLARGASSSTGALPKASPEFYRDFFGALQLADDTLTALTVRAQVQYLGSPPL